MDRDKIATELAKDLDRALVKPPPQGKFGDYVPAFDIFTTANRIFGHLGWSDKIVGDVEVVWSGVVETRNGEQFRATCRATVEVTAWPEDGAPVTHVGVGYGHGFSKLESPGDAIESAGKEAETDAVKRALRKFGNSLGLALYDKTQAHVSEDPDAAVRDPKIEADRLLEALRHTADCDLSNWSKTNTGTLKWLRTAAREEYDRVSQECVRRSNAKQQEHT